MYVGRSAFLDRHNKFTQMFIIECETSSLIMYAIKKKTKFCSMNNTMYVAYT